MAARSSGPRGVLSKSAGAARPASARVPAERSGDDHTPSVSTRARATPATGASASLRAGSQTNRRGSASPRK
jgi:hypothetical protein